MVSEGTTDMGDAYKGGEGAVKDFLDPRGEVFDLQRQPSCTGRLQDCLLDAKHTQGRPCIA